MGLFEDLGRKVGEFTHEAKQAASESANYACTDCGHRFYADRETCPECGSEAVIERETASAGDDGADESTDASNGAADESTETTDAAETTDATESTDVDGADTSDGADTEPADADPGDLIETVEPTDDAPDSESGSDSE